MIENIVMRPFQIIKFVTQASLPISLTVIIPNRERKGCVYVICYWINPCHKQEKHSRHKRANIYYLEPRAGDVREYFSTEASAVDSAWFPP